MTASACAAKASFNSMTPIWSRVRPASFSALGMANTGPRPISSGLQPAVAKATKRASGLSAESFGALGGHHHRGGGAIAHLRGVAGGHRALHVERRLERGQSFERGIGARTFVHLELDGLHRELDRRRPRGLRGRARKVTCTGTISSAKLPASMARSAF